MYRKRAGTSGISGQLYESKLISLLYFRSLHDDRITDFILASNVDSIGAFDDMCFKAEVEGFDKPIAFFVQAKHKENKEQAFKIDLDTYFSSYLKIRQCFDPSKKDLFFKGTYDDVECLFVLYTTARDDFTNDTKVESSFCSILNDLIDTGGTVKQPYKQDKDVKFLCKVAMNEQMISLAERLAKFINGDSNFQMMLIDELVQCYHVILAEKVVKVSELQPDGFRIVSFRHEFFDTHEEYLVVFKNTLLIEISKKIKIEPVDIKHFLSDFLNEPTDALKLSKLVGTVTTYNNGQLEFNKQYTKDFMQDMKPIHVSRSTFNEAVELAAKEVLLSPKFKLRVPSAFGNTDITLSGSDTKKKRRINYLALKIIDLLVNCKSGNIITVDDSLGDGFLQLNGGIAGAIGNIFVLDDNSKLMKITNNKESLGTLAKQLYERLNEEIRCVNEIRSNNQISDLCEYKFCFEVNKFPKLLLDCSEHEETARDFFSKLVIYSNQSDETGVEKILKDEIEENQLNQTNYFQAKNDAIFAKFHDEIQKWWMQPKQAQYLTRKSDLIKKAKNIIKDQLLSVINLMYCIKIKNVDYTFSENAMRALNLQDQYSSTVITTENSVLTVVKVMQHLKNKSHSIIDLDYVINLPSKDRNALRTELRDTHKDKIIILVCDKMKQNKRKFLENVIEEVHNKNTFIVTKHTSVEIFQKCFPKSYIKHDEKNSLDNMSEESQESIMESAKVMFQGTEVSLGLIVDEKSKVFVKGDVLHKIIKKETIAVGKLTVKTNYDEIKQYHVERRIRKAGINPPSNPIMYYTSKNKDNHPTSLKITSVSYENDSVGSSVKSIKAELSLSTKVVKTPDNTLDEKQINEASDRSLEENLSLSTEVVKTLENTLDVEQRNDVSDETLEEKSSLSTAVIKTLDNTSKEVQTNESIDETLVEKSNISSEVAKTPENTFNEKQRNEASNRSLVENSNLSTKVVKTSDNTLDEKQINEASDRSLEENSSFSTEVVRTLENILDVEQRNDVSDETLEEKSSLSTTVVKTLDNTSKEVKFVEKSNSSSEVVKTLENTSDEKHKTEFSDRSFEERSRLATLVINAPDNTLDEKQKKKGIDETIGERSKLSTELVKTLDNALDEKQKKAISDETLEENSSLSTTVVEILDNTLDEKQKNNATDRSFEENSSHLTEVVKTLENTLDIEQKNNVSDETLERISNLSNTVVKTLDNTSDVKQNNEVSDETLEDRSSLSSEVVKTLENTVDIKQRSDMSEETLEEISNFLTADIKTPHKTSEEAQKIDDTLERKAGVSGVVVKSLNITSEIPEDIVLITAEPGMGKTTLLTHLSIKTKELKPEVWIIRINLLEYSEEFSKWKEEKTAIDLLQTLKFMCKVLLREKLGEKNNVEITLEEKHNVMYLKHCIADPMIEFELNLFLHFYCEREMIFLFDGFDEICPHYTDVVIKCIKCVSNNPRKHKMWITSRSYNKVKTILEEEFGPSYEIDNFSRMEMEKYLHTFWQFNLRLNDLNSQQLENVKQFLEYMSVVKYEQIPVAEPLYDVFRIAAYYLSNEIKNTHIPLWKYDKNYNEIICYKSDPFVHEQIYDANPLFLYLAAFYVVYHLKKEHRKFEEWYVDFDTFIVYKRFLENKIKRRYQEKNKINIYNSDIITAYEKELSESIFNHKRLGAYAMFNKYSDVLFSEKDLKEINEMINVVEKGVEKTGLVDSVVNGIPIFTHMSFTEYFAVEYVCDCLKDAKYNKYSLVFLAVIFTTSNLMNVRKIFDHKIKFDKTLMSVLEDNHRVIFSWIWSKTHIIFGKDNSRRFVCYPFLITVVENLNHWELLFSKMIDYAIQNTNLTDTIDISELGNLFNTRSYVNQFEHFFLKY